MLPSRKNTAHSFIFVALSLVFLCVCSGCQQRESSDTIPFVSIKGETQNGQTSQDGPEIVYFTISPEIGHSGDWYRFAWETRGADRVTIEPCITGLPLEPTGAVAGQVQYSTWFTLIAEKDGLMSKKKAWVEVWFPGGSTWRMPRADASNSAYSPYPGPLTNWIRWIYPLKKFFHPQITIGNDCSVFVSDTVSGTCYTPQRHSLIVLNPDGTDKFDKKDFLENQVLGPDGTIYCSDIDLFKALFPDGSTKWTIDLWPTMDSDSIRYVSRSTYIDQHGTIVLFEKFNQRNDPGNGFYIITSNGEVEFQWGGESFFWWDVALNCDQTVLFTAGSYLYCVNYHGETLWHHGPVSYYDHRFFGSLITDPMCRIYGRIYVDNNQNHTGIMALDGMGNELWRLTGLRICSPMARAEDGTLYVVLEDQDTEDGLALCAVHYLGWVIWTVPLRGSCENSAPVVDVCGHIYVTTTTHVTAFNYDGTELWRYHDPDEEFETIALSMDGSLYTVGKKGLYAFGE